MDQDSIRIERGVQPALKVVVAVAARDGGVRTVGGSMDAAFGHSSDRSGYLTTIGRIDQIEYQKFEEEPLALAIKNQIPAIPRIEKFYDGSELLLSDDWAADLESNIAHSTVLIVRTDRFDERLRRSVERTAAVFCSRGALGRQRRTRSRVRARSLQPARTETTPAGAYLRTTGVRTRSSLG